MTGSRRSHARAAALALGFSFAVAANAYYVVVPNAYDTAPSFGDGLNTINRNTGNPRTYQMIINSNQLTAISVGDQIVSVTFRLYNAAPSAWPTADVTYTDYDLFIGPSVDPASMVTTFASNWVGSGPTQVMDGPFTIPAGSFGWTATNPKPWATVEWTFSTPYTYTGGHLGLLFSHPGSTSAEVQFLDALATTRPGYGVDYRAASATGQGAATGAFASFTIMRMNVVPEPASLIAVVAGVGVLVARRRRK